MSKLRECRERKGYSRQQLAEMVGAYDGAIVFRWEQEPGNPNRRIPAEIYMLKLYEIFGGEVDPNSFYPLPDLDQHSLPLEPLPAPPPAPLLDGPVDSQAAAAVESLDQAAA